MGTIIVTVTLGCVAMGFSAGLMGCIVSLRNRNLEADVVVHCTMPGLLFGIICSQLLNLNVGMIEKLIITTCGISAAALSTLCLARFSYLAQKRFGLSPDIIQACILSFGFGLSLILLSITQSYLPVQYAGFHKLLVGNAAVLTQSDAVLCGILALLLTVLTWIFKHQIASYLFDPQSWALKTSSFWMAEALYTAALFLVILAGMRVVGAVLMIALLTIPWLTIKLWIRTSFWYQCVTSALVGAMVAGFGVFASQLTIANATNGLPTGPTIVIVAMTLCILSITTKVIHIAYLEQRHDRI